MRIYYFTEARPVFGKVTIAGLRKLGAKMRRWKPKRRKSTLCKNYN